MCYAIQICLYHAHLKIKRSDKTWAVLDLPSIFCISMTWLFNLTASEQVQVRWRLYLNYHSEVEGCFLILKNLLRSQRLHLFNQKCSKSLIFWIIIITTVFYLNVFKCNLFLWCKAEFHHHYFSLQCHMIFQKSDLLLNKQFLLLSMLKTKLCYFIYLCKQ